MGVNGPLLCDAVAQGREGQEIEIVIDALKHDDIRPGTGDHGGHGQDLRIVATADIAQQKAGAIAFKFGMEGGKPQGVCRPARGPPRRQKGDQACCNASDSARA